MERLQAKPEEWWRVTSLDDGISLIDEPFIKPFYRCNCWHVRGEGADLLVDSGMGVVSLRTWVPLVTERPLLAVASHTHFDHIGCHHEFDCRAVHRAEAHVLANPSRAETLAEPYVCDAMFDVFPPGSFSAAGYEVCSAPATRLLEDGEEIEVGGRVFEVLHTPGHSPGGIALWEARTGVLFSGDIIYDGPLVEDAPHSSLDEYAVSLERLLSLPVRVVHGGHFPSFGGVRLRALITSWLKEHGRQASQNLFLT
ncbi:MBL fold metallo-hydrolase [Haematospirillum sp. H1815]|uniref:MBL fold metallo-hydrolase n=1 Tax=Haematospirillum sp. H1815 TaxID=2723108 RepID=UPI00143BCF2C|nr:MBL fold metallo-hydrolase [Haematospirillum sp. H1815]NKD76761.1 MBL fold metallo-hydrolase [Haematospirillum sp. H1815]